MLFSILNILNLILATLFQFYIAKNLPAYQADFVFLNISVSSVIISMSTAGLSGYLISSFSKGVKTGESKDLFSEKFSFFIILFVPISFLVGFFTFIWGVINFDEMSFQECSLLSTIFIFLTLTTALTLLIQSYSYSIRKQVKYEFIGFGSFCLCLFLFIILDARSVFALPIILVLRNLMTIGIFVFYYMRNFSFFIISISKFKAVLHDVRIMISGGAIYKSEPIIDRLMVSNLPGAITSLHLIMQIYNASLGLFFKVFTSPAIVAMSNKYNESGYIGLKEEVVKIIYKVILIGTSISSIIIFTPLIDFILTLSIFSSLKDSAVIIRLLSAYFLISFVGQIISNTFYVMEDFKTPVLVSTLSFCIFIPLKIYFTMQYGLIALSVLIVAYHMVNTTILSFIIFRFFYVKNSLNY